MTVTALPTTHPEPEGRPTSGAAGRWVPARAGILNVWRYYDEVFEFHNGRLLLRGPNGTGKSKALELLLPYLFDASLRANRLSTFGTSERTMHWNLMGEGATGTTRVGYVWLEFAAGTDSWFTCGARLQASSHTSAVHADYFTTSLRVGQSLSLANEAGSPLTKAVLAERLGEHGAVHANATDYRSTVRQTLFPGLSEQRYDALITALLQLRTPKLSQRLDPGLLSTLLSRALPPLGQDEVAELAEGFERLDRQRDHLVRLDKETEAARMVADRQRSYAQRVLRAASAEVISTTDERDRLTRIARESEEEHRAAVAEENAITRRAGELEDTLEQVRARIDGLTNREEYRQGRELDTLRQQERRARQEAESSAEDAAARQATARDDAGRAATADEGVRRWEEAVRVAESGAEQAARRADLHNTHAEIRGELGAGGQRARQLLRAAVAGRNEQIAAVRAALEKHERAVETRRAAEEQLERARRDLAALTAHRARVLAAYDDILARQHELLLAWARGCAELAFADPEDLAGRAESETAVIEYVEEVTRRRLHEITTEETTLRAASTEAQRERGRLADDLAALHDAVELPPDPPPHRTADRCAPAGAPLWKLVAFAEGVPAGIQGRVEAALQASGLLDAWLTSSGAVTVDGHDTLAGPDLLEPAPGRSLRDVLRPEPDGPVPVELVERLLSAVAYGPSLPDAHPAAVGADGRWRLATVTGSWAKDEAAHIGAAARERNRQRRIAELAARVATCEAEISRIGTALDVLAGRRRLLDAERRERPPHTPVADARRELDAADAHVGAADRTVNHATEALSERERQAAAGLRELSLAATTARAPAERAALDTLARAVESFQEAAALWLAEHADLVSARNTAELLRSQAQRSAAAAEQTAEKAEQARTGARALAEKVRAVTDSIGADYREILAEIEQLRGTQQRLSQEIRAATDSLRELARTIGGLEDRLGRAAEDRDSATSQRDVVVARFRQLVAGTFPKDTGIELKLSTSDGIKATLQAARSIAGRWPNVPHAPSNLSDAFSRLAEAVHECREALGGHADLELETDDEVQVLTAVVDGVRVGARELHDSLLTEAERARGDITAAERELFDKTLTGDTRRQLADRIRQAGELVDAMNARLERVRTASRIAVRLVWQVDTDLPPGTKAARELLLKDPVRLSEGDREALHRFFRDRIEQAKVENTASSWHQQLAQVFDYTSWHQFVVKLDRADGKGWQPLTKRMHGALSGGEKAIALHLPLFAAVAAHYQAVPEAPRLILLDEVFVGVDSANRGQVFELLTSLDLDLVLTSDHEWCTYRELPGIAVHQLITEADDDAVTTARFVWTGTGWQDEPE